MPHFVLSASAAWSKCSDIEVRIMHFAAGNPFADPQLFAKREFAAIKYSTRPSTEIVMHRTIGEGMGPCPEMLHSVHTCIGTQSQMVGRFL